MRSLLKPVLTGVMLVFITAPARADVPQPIGAVNDFAQILDPEARQSLSSSIQRVEEKTSAEVALVTVQSLQDRPIEEYAVELFQSWGIGKKGRDNGALILIAPNERKMRIEVGYGLEPILPDGLCGEIIRNEFTPSFKEGKYGEGIVRGTLKVLEIIEKQEPAAPAKTEALKKFGGPVGLLIFLGIFVGIGFLFAGVGMGARVFFLIMWGLFFGGIPLLIALAALPGRLAEALLIPFSIYMLISGWRQGKKQRGTLRRGGRGFSGSGWIFGGGARTGSGWGGGGFSGGGFGGFGGGSSGGGGASGSW